LAGFTAGDIVIADWRGDALSKEPNKLRPAVVIQDETLFGPNYPNVILVPLTEDAGLAIQDLVEPIEPSTENGCTKRCFALAPFVASTSQARVRATKSRITADQLARIRRQVAEAIGLG
jgi:mRNA-degrading endonuclease toxin of MazEF toxin-antitoxin module